jgi:hypothetical protein
MAFTIEWLFIHDLLLESELEKLKPTPNMQAMVSEVTCHKKCQDFISNAFTNNGNPSTPQSPNRYQDWNQDVS